MKKDYTLTKEYLNELFDYKDGNLYWKKSRKGISNNLLAGTKSTHYYQICINYKIYRTHRLIWIFHNGNTEDCIDHINGNTFDNHIENLRICDLAKNSWNSKIRKNNTSGVKGIGWCLQKKKWRARVVCKNKEFHVGFFDDLEKAKIKIKEKRQELHKEFSNNG